MTESSYDHRVTLACPVGHYPDFQELEGAFGEGLSDHLVPLTGPRAKRYQDASGNLFIVISAACTSTLLQRTNSGTVDRPGYDSEQVIDLVAAQRALDKVVIYSGTETASPDIILSVIDVPAVEAIGLMGLTGIPVEE